jgi:hypothetical protein
MAKKSRLTLVDPSALTVLSPPSTLGEAGNNLWRAIMAEYDIRDSGGREMLRQICEATDSVDEFSRVIAHDGPVVRTKAGPKDHPLIKHQLAARAFVVRSLHRLGLDVEPIGRIGRPSQGGIGWRGDDGDE